MGAEKIVVIGGGSSYTPELMSGLISRYEILKTKEVVLVDVPEASYKLGIINDFTKRMFKDKGIDIDVKISFNRREALKDCNYVITQFRVGGLESRSRDEKIPLKYNTIGQETTGPGGFLKALRTIPVILELAKDMEDICPDAWLINFTNPSGIVTEAVNTYSKIKCIGLCNVPINMQKSMSDLFNVGIDDVYCEFIGLNHLSYIKKVFVKGIDKTEEIFKKDGFKDSIVKNIPSVKGANKLIESLKLIPSPYLYYYYFEKIMLEKELEELNSGIGTRADVVKKVETILFEIYKDENVVSKPKELDERGGGLYSEAALSLIESIECNLNRVHVVNIKNNGAITDLEEGDVVETNCLVNSSGARPIASGKMPESIGAFVKQVKAYEKLTIKAAVEGSREAAFNALLNHPLVHGADLAEELLEEMLNCNKEYLPQFFNGVK